MKNSNYTLTLRTDQSPEQVFITIMNVRGWWSGLYEEEFSGASEKAGDEFTFRAGNGAHYSKQKLLELIPNKKVVWLVTDSSLSFIEKPDEWTGSKVVFNISQKADHTEVRFTHEGLTPEVECYDVCAPTWTTYLQNKLLPLITNRLEARDN